MFFEKTAINNLIKTYTGREAIRRKFYLPDKLISDMRESVARSQTQHHLRKSNECNHEITKIEQLLSKSTKHSEISIIKFRIAEQE